MRKPWSCPPTPRSRFQMSWGPCHCQETGFVPMSRTTPCRILNVCAQIPSRTWLCLSRNAKAFEESADVIQKLSDNPHGKGLSWPKDQSGAVGLSYFQTLYLLQYLKSVTLPWTDQDDFLQSNNVQTLSLTNKTPWGYSFTCTVAQRVNPCEWNDLQFGVTSQWLCAQLNLKLKF